MKIHHRCPRYFIILSDDLSGKGLEPWSGGGGHSGTEWLHNAKRQHRVEVVNNKIYEQ